MKQQKAIVFFSAGLGDAVLLIPLLKHLKKHQFRVTGLFNSHAPCEEIFLQGDLLDERITCRTAMQQAWVAFSNAGKYDLAVVNYFALNRKNLFCAVLLSKKIHVNRKADSIIEKIFGRKISYTEPLPGIHDSLQNLRMIGGETTSLPDFSIEFISKKEPALPSSFIALQLSAGNNKVTYKNWPVTRWLEFLRTFQKEFPAKNIVLLGDSNETGLSQKITDELKSNIVSLTGRTTVEQVMNILSQCELFIGLDGGLMHLAVALGKPTFTIWGPSSETLYGYQQFDLRYHQCVRFNLNCYPCSAWIGANHSKATSPEICPDHACIQQFDEQEVFSRFKKYVHSLGHAG